MYASLGGSLPWLRGASFTLMKDSSMSNWCRQLRLIDYLARFAILGPVLFLTVNQGLLAQSRLWYVLFILALMIYTLAACYLCASVKSITFLCLNLISGVVISFCYEFSFNSLHNRIAELKELVPPM